MSLLNDSNEENQIRLDPLKEEDLSKLEDILKKRSYSRTKDELSAIFLLIRDNEFFKKFWTEMPVETHISLLQEFQYEFIKKGQAIFQYGETGKSFYVLLKGSVAVIAPDKRESKEVKPSVKIFNDLVKSHDVQDNKEAPSKLEESLTPKNVEKNKKSSISKLVKNESQKSQHSRARSSDLNTSHHSKSNIHESKSNLVADSKFKNSPKNSPEVTRINFDTGVDTKQTQNTIFNFNDAPEILVMHDESPFMTDEEILDRYPGYYMLNTLNAGSHFGEIALTHNVLRTASVICKEDCHVMKLRSRAYRSIISDYYSSCERDRMALVRRIPMVADWPEQNMTGLMRQIKEVSFGRNKVIYEIGQKWDYFYIIKNGEVELIKEVDFETKHSEDNFEVMSKKDIYVSIDRAKMIKMNSLWNTRLQKHKKRYVRVALLGQGQTFGEEEVASENAMRKNRAVVISSTADLLMIPIMKFIENAPNPTDFYSKLVKKYVKNQWRDFFSRDMARITEDKKIEAKNLMVNPKIDAINKNAETINVFNITGLVKKEDIKIYKTASYASIMAAPLENSMNESTARAISYKPNFISSDHPQTTARTTRRESDIRILEIESQKGPEYSEIIGQELQGLRSKRVPSAASRVNTSMLSLKHQPIIPPLSSDPMRHSQYVDKPEILTVQRSPTNVNKSPASRQVSPKRYSSTAYSSPIPEESNKVGGMSRLWKRNSRTYDRENRKYDRIFSETPGPFENVSKNAKIMMIKPMTSQATSAENSLSPNAVRLKALINNDDIDDETKKILKEEKNKLEKQVLYRKLGVDKLFGSAFRKASIDLTDLSKLVNMKSVSDPLKELLSSKQTDHSPKQSNLLPKGDNIHTNYPQLVPTTRIKGRKLSMGELPNVNNLNHQNMGMRGKGFASTKRL